MCFREKRYAFNVAYTRLSEHRNLVQIIDEVTKAWSEDRMPDLYLAQTEILAKSTKYLKEKYNT